MEQPAISSPVPDDDNLASCELPFTAFGQFGEGHLDMRVFDQDVFWVNVRGLAHRIDTEMSQEYVTAVIAFLSDNVSHFHWGQVKRELLTVITDGAMGILSAQTVALAAGVPSTGETDPVVWLESTPLMRKLRSRAALFETS